MYIEQRFQVNAGRAVVWDMMRDPEQMLECVPGCSAIEKISETLYKAQVELAVGPIKAQFVIDVEITQETPPAELFATSRGEEGSQASVLKADNIIRLNEVDANTTDVFYSSELELSGRLGRYGSGMIKKIADRHAAKFAQAFKVRVEKGDCV